MPKHAIKELKEFGDLQDMQEELWNWCKLALTSPGTTRKQRSNILFMYELMCRVMEAIYSKK